METTGKVDGFQTSDLDVRLCIPDREFHRWTGTRLVSLWKQATRGLKSKCLRGKQQHVFMKAEILRNRRSPGDSLCEPSFKIKSIVSSQAPRVVGTHPILWGSHHFFARRILWVYNTSLTTNKMLPLSLSVSNYLAGTYRWMYMVCLRKQSPWKELHFKCLPVSKISLTVSEVWTKSFPSACRLLQILVPSMPTAWWEERWKRKVSQSGSWSPALKDGTVSDVGVCSNKTTGHTQ